jgi:hypothetical protein
MDVEPAPGVAVILCVCRGFGKPARLVPCRFPTNVQCDKEWWPLSAAAVALFTLRKNFGDRALCTRRTV